MCNCQPSFVCSRCAGTPFDVRYLDDEPAPISEDAFADLVAEPSLGPILMFGEGE